MPKPSPSTPPTPTSLSGYTGPITITEHTPNLDRVELNGSAIRDLSLETVPSANAITPIETAYFQAHIRSNAAMSTPPPSLRHWACRR